MILVKIKLDKSKRKTGSPTYHEFFQINHKFQRSENSRIECEKIPVPFDMRRNNYFQNGNNNWANSPNQNYNYNRQYNNGVDRSNMNRRGGHRNFTQGGQGYFPGPPRGSRAYNNNQTNRFHWFNNGSGSYGPASDKMNTIRRNIANESENSESQTNPPQLKQVMQQAQIQHQHQNSNSASHSKSSIVQYRTDNFENVDRLFKSASVSQFDESTVDIASNNQQLVNSKLAVPEFIKDSEILINYGVWVYLSNFPSVLYDNNDLIEFQFTLSNLINEHNIDNGLIGEAKIQHANFAMIQVISGAVLIIVTRSIEKDFLKNTSALLLMKQGTNPTVRFHNETGSCPLKNVLTITTVNNDVHASKWKTIIHKCAEIPFSYDESKWTYCSTRCAFKLKQEEYIIFDIAGPDDASESFYKTYKEDSVSVKKNFEGFNCNITVQLMVFSPINLASISRNNYSKIAESMNKSVSSTRQYRADPHFFLPCLNNFGKLITTSEYVETEMA